MLSVPSNSVPANKPVAELTLIRLRAQKKTSTTVNPSQPSTDVRQDRRESFVRKLSCFSCLWSCKAHWFIPRPFMDTQLGVTYGENFQIGKMFL